MVLRAERCSAEAAWQASEAAATSGHRCTPGELPVLVIRAGVVAAWFVADGRARTENHGLVLMPPAPLEPWLARYRPCVPWVWAEEFARVLTHAGHDTLARAYRTVQSQADIHTGPDQLWESLSSAPSEEHLRCTTTTHPSN
ncbi:hypothetical protein LZ318_30985 [Saccharopolyspora indica]|uniref:hypothetical protein n=1 Tax=Saccharopolyspora indica TaxID=1229659 RepID=UPI0022EB52FE|nr:hypothetical protein [Saccharopolyspora indica]MDA3644341.1 hypothetical protein [Saccharopolyspora indica]